MGIIQLTDPDSLQFNTQDKLYHDGIELEKGVVITPYFLEKNQDFLQECFQIFAAYPDIFLDLITPVNSNFTLFPYQRIFLRACMRYTSIYITAARATSKTFLSILAKYLQCIFLPNHVGSIVAPNKGQAAKISKQKIQEIWRIWPLLKKSQSQVQTMACMPILVKIILSFSFEMARGLQLLVLQTLIVV